MRAMTCLDPWVIIDRAMRLILIGPNDGKDTTLDDVRIAGTACLSRPGGGSLAW
jgi:hypothetical protein